MGIHYVDDFFLLLNIYYFDAYFHCMAVICIIIPIYFAKLSGQKPAIIVWLYSMHVVILKPYYSNVAH